MLFLLILGREQGLHSYVLQSTEVLHVLMQVCCVNGGPAGAGPAARSPVWLQGCILQEDQQGHRSPDPPDPPQARRPACPTCTADTFPMSDAIHMSQFLAVLANASRHQADAGLHAKTVHDMCEARKHCALCLCSGGARTTTQARLVLTLLYALNVTISYLLMLAVMTYNVGYFIIIVLGLALGHFFSFNEASASAPADTCCPQPLL